MSRLADLYEETMKSDQLTEDDIVDARDAAIEAIIAAGFDESDSDQLGDEMSNHVQTLLTLAFVRCPNLVKVVSYTLFDPSAENM